MGCRRKHSRRHRRPFLKVTEAETTADLGALTGRLRRALQEADVLGLPDVHRHLDAALRLATEHAAEPAEVAGQAPEARSFGQHAPETEAR